MPKVNAQFCVGAETLTEIDSFAKLKGLSRSRLLELAVLRVMKKDGSITQQPQS